MNGEENFIYWSGWCKIIGVVIWQNGLMKLDMTGEYNFAVGEIETFVSLMSVKETKKVAEFWI